MERLGMTGSVSDEQRLESQLARFGVDLADVRYVLHTHLHIDHAGQDDRFPTSTTVVINRRELEYSVSGLMGEQYPGEYVKHLVDRLHTPGAAIKKALNSGTFVLPIHDHPARVEHGRVVSRLKESVPGPEEPVEHRLVSEAGGVYAQVMTPTDPTPVAVGG
jgi:hypothetical protein